MCERFLFFDSEIKYNKHSEIKYNKYSETSKWQCNITSCIFEKKNQEANSCGFCANFTIWFEAKYTYMRFI